MAGQPPKTGRIELHNWCDFTKVMEAMKVGRWIFRGHEDASWTLESGLDRYLKQFGISGIRKGENKSRSEDLLMTFPRAEYFAISRFRAMSRLPEEANPNTEALIAMQHYGAKTRLLDFTTSIIVALFFAYENQYNGRKRAIYAINFKSLLDQSGMWCGYRRFLKDKVNCVDIGDEQARWIVESQIENHYFQQFVFAEAERLITENAQDGHINILPLYTVGTNKRQMAQTGIELMPSTFDWFDNNLARALSVNVEEIKNPQQIEKELNALDVLSLEQFDLVKIVFDSQMEKGAWQYLDQANINAATIYPDLVGIAKSTRYNNSTMVIDDKLGRPKESELVSNFWIPRDEIIARRLSDTISSAIDKMTEGKISHVPVLDEAGKVIGVFSENTMMEAWKAKLNCGADATMNSIASLLPINKHKADVFEFVSKDVTAAGLKAKHLQFLENNKRIGLFLVTENGRCDEPLLGIATPWDVAEALDEKADNPDVEIKTV